MIALGQPDVVREAPPRPRDAQAPLRRREVIGAARAIVRHVEAHAPAATDLRVPVMELARRLGIVIHRRSELGATARWHRRLLCENRAAPRLWDSGPTIVDIVELRRGLRYSAQRFAIAHEIGHILLHRHHPELAARLPLESEELFAHTFAAELLVPRRARHELANRVRRMEQPSELLRLADALGVSPSVVLRFAREEAWLAETDRVWLDIRHIPNRYTHRERRLRIHDAVFDRRRWYVPTNRSVAGVFGSDIWLAALGRKARTMTCSMAISRRNSVARPRYVSCQTPVTVTAVGLQRLGPDRGMELLAVATIRGGHARPAKGDASS